MYSQKQWIVGYVMYVQSERMHWRSTLTQIYSSSSCSGSSGFALHAQCYRLRPTLCFSVIFERTFLITKYRPFSVLNLYTGDHRLVHTLRCVYEYTCQLHFIFCISLCIWKFRSLVSIRCVYEFKHQT